MIRIIWMLRYVRVALRSRYEFSISDAWCDAGYAWDDSDGGAMTPADAFRENAFDWRFG